TLHLSEDRLFLYDCLLASKGISITNFCGYNYYISEGLSKKLYSFEDEYNRIQKLSAALASLRDRFNLNHDEFKPAFLFHLNYVVRLANTIYHRSRWLGGRIQFFKELHKTYIGKEYRDEVSMSQ